MSVLINTGDLPATQRWQAWCHTICDTVGPLDVRKVDQDAPLWGRINAGTLGPARLAKVTTNAAHTAHRTPGLIRRDSAELYRVALALGGRHVIAQGERQAVLEPGDFALYDYTRPYDLGFSAEFRLALFVFPQAALSLPRDQVAGLTAVAIDGRQPTARLVSHMLRHLSDDLDHSVDGYPPATGTRLSAILLDLISAALAERLDRPAPLPRPAQRQLLFHRVHAFIEEHLADVTLTPAAVAAAHYLSLRSLQQLFAEHGSTVAGFIRHRRLERCRTDLIDPAQTDIPVSAIATRWGLPDPTGFSRLFHRTYGITAVDYRHVFQDGIA